MVQLARFWKRGGDPEESVNQEREGKNLGHPPPLLPNAEEGKGGKNRREEEKRMKMGPVWGVGNSGAPLRDSAGVDFSEQKKMK